MRVWRIAVDAPDYTAEDLRGEGARRSGGRWNRRGVPLVYASSSVALACLESLVHVAASPPLPLNRYLVEIDIPADVWRRRTRFERASALVGWDAEPPGRVSLDWGSQWAVSMRSLIAEVPSVVVSEESNVLINPAHPAAASLRGAKRRRFDYDRRLR